MRKLLLALVGLVALVAAGVAVAHGVEGAGSASAVSGTFSAAAGNVTTSSCTTSDNKSITVTRGTYTGTASGDADLSGAITLRTESDINTTDDVGTVTGRLQIKTANGNTEGMFTSVYSSGSLAGLATGRAGASALLGNVSATFSPTTGFTNGKIGGGTSGGAAVELSRGGCQGSSSGTDRSEAFGSISAVSSSQITVAGLTCSVPSNVDVSSYKTGDDVVIQCTLASGDTTPTLTKISAHGHGSSGSSGSSGSHSTRQPAGHGHKHRRR
ncbi:MAG TPA: hypothetical protein VFB25_00525 [Gaiellaceae bacterium]|nr:hypothetical protein [Gaiellaceae bacterium]